MTETPPKLISKKRPLSIYNMWVRNYAEHENGAFAGMTQDLDRVAKDGYNALYLNPFYQVGAYPKKTGEVGSLYATSDMSRANPALFAGQQGKFIEDGQVTELGQQVQTFTQKAKAQGITPMFDLVQGQLSPDSPYIEDAKSLEIDILLTNRETGTEVE